MGITGVGGGSGMRNNVHIIIIAVCDHLLLPQPQHLEARRSDTLSAYWIIVAQFDILGFH